MGPGDSIHPTHGTWNLVTLTLGIGIFPPPCTYIWALGSTPHYLSPEISHPLYTWVLELSQPQHRPWNLLLPTPPPTHRFWYLILTLQMGHGNPHPATYKLNDPGIFPQFPYTLTLETPLPAHGPYNLLQSKSNWPWNICLNCKKKIHATITRP